MMTFEEFYQQNHNLIYGRMVLMFNDRWLAEDVTQDIFLKAFKAYPPDKEQNLHGWLNAITTNTAIDVLRRRKWRQTHLDDRPLDTLAYTLSSDTDLADIITKQDLSPQFQRLWFALPLKNRQVLWLRSQGFSHEKIAVILHCTVNSSRITITRTRRHFAQMLR